MHKIDLSRYPLDKWAQESYTTLWGQLDAYSTVLDGVERLHECLEPRLDPRDKVIVRNEYKLLWDEIVVQSTTRHRGMVVWGGPGIGKTLFLRYALGRALEERRPIILCEDSTYFLYFDDSGVQRITYNGDGYPKLPKRIIALFDSTENMLSPNQFFLNSSCPAFVVQATSPQESRWSQWSKQLKARIWVMMPWSREEISQLDVVLGPTPPNHYTALEICDYLGPSARQCATPTIKTADVEGDFSLKPLSLDNPAQLLSQIQLSTIEDDISREIFHQYFYVYRLPDRKSYLFRQAPTDWCEYWIPTQFLLRKLFQEVQTHTLVKQKEMCHLLSPLPRICGAAYEALGIQFLSQPISFRFASGSTWSTEIFSSSLPIKNLPALSPDLTPDFPNVVWVPSADFPTIDAVVVSDGGKRISLLQMTITREHDIKPEGISRIWRLFGERAFDLRWEFLFVVPSDKIGQELCGRRNKIVQRAPAPLTREPNRVCQPKIEMSVGYTVALFMTEEEASAMADEFTLLQDDEVAGGIVEVDLGV